MYLPLWCKIYTMMINSAENKKKFCYEYPHPAVTTDCVIFGFDGKELKVLLIERGIEPFKGQWALPGGFVRMDETLDECARRELREEAGIDNCFMEQFATFSAVDRDPRERVITNAYYALVRMREVQGGDDARRADWFSLSELPRLAFDHARILQAAFERLRERIYFRPVGFELLHHTFTMTELQLLYEAILGTRFDRRNFAKKMIHTGVLRSVPDPMAGPAKWEFDEKAYHELKNRNSRTEF